MNSQTAPGRLEARFEAIVVIALKLLLMIIIVAAVLMLFFLSYVVLQRFRLVQSVPELQEYVQHGFAGVLLVVLGLELLETLRIFFTEHRVKLELILIVAIIAVGRHIILLDFEHASGVVLIGVAALVLALTSGYYLVHLSVNRTSPESADEAQ
jgi:uncharacterized membrane protein (DUF373 family)